MSGIEEILAGDEGLRAAREAFYQDLHRHPELSHAEHQPDDLRRCHHRQRRLCRATA